MDNRMDIIITHESALEYWRLHSSVKINDAARLRRKNPPVSLPGISEIRDKAPSGLTYPLNLMVGEANAKRKSKVVNSHVYTGPTPGGSFIGIGDGVAVCAPQFCFFQMAGELPLIKLIELGLELCGTYSKPPIDEYDPGAEGPDKTVYNHLPLTNVQALKNYTARMEGVKGHKNAVKALRYIADGSGSPMETTLFMLLTVPYKHGGYGLPAPELNKRIEITTTYNNKPRKTYYVCDLFWEQAGFAIEYDSDFYHASTDRIARDAKRRFDLAAHGIIAIAVTSKQIRNTLELENLAKLVAKKSGRQLRYKTPQFQEKQRELRNLLK